jgi:hypothetical protein
MIIKKFIIGLFVLVLAGIVTEPVHALTIAEIQAQIAGLQTQIAALQAQLGQHGTSTGTSTPSGQAFITLTTQKSDEVWPRATRPRVSWATSLTAKTVDMYLVSRDSDKSYSLVKNLPIKKHTYLVRYERLNNIPLGKYKVKIVYTSGGTTLSDTSVGTIEITPHLPPTIQVTSPLEGVTWDNGKQRITWAANFAARQNRKSGKWGNIKFVPWYGIGPDLKSIALARFSGQDRDILTKLSKQDLESLANLSDEQLEQLSLGTINIPNLSIPGLSEISKLSQDALEHLEDLDLLGVGSFTRDALLKPIEMLQDIDPVFDAVMDSIGDLFGGGEEPRYVKMVAHAIPVGQGIASTTKYKLGQTYVEKSKMAVNFKKLPPGQYKVRLTAQVAGDKVVAESGVFTLVQKTGSTTPSSTGSTTPSSNKSITVTNPSATSVWSAGSIRSVRWMSRGVPIYANVTVSLENPSIGFVKTYTATTNVGERSITIPSTLPSGQDEGYVIKVKARVNGVDVVGISAPFVIGITSPAQVVVPPTVPGLPESPTVNLKANGADALSVAPNTNIALTWVSTHVASCASTGGSGSWPNSSRATSNFVGVTATSPASGSVIYTITCKSSNGQTATDSVVVTIDAAAAPSGSGPTITVVRPNGSETLRSGQYYTVNWKKERFVVAGKVDIWLIDAGSNQGRLIASRTDNDGGFYWRVAPLTDLYDQNTNALITPSGRYLIRIECSDAACASDTSDASFSISTAVSTLSSEEQAASVLGAISEILSDLQESISN